MDFKKLEDFYGRELHGQFKCFHCGCMSWSSMGYKGDNGKAYCGGCKNKVCDICGISIHSPNFAYHICVKK